MFVKEFDYAIPRWSVFIIESIVIFGKNRRPKQDYSDVQEFIKKVEAKAKETPGYKEGYFHYSQILGFSMPNDVNDKRETTIGVTFVAGYTEEEQ